MARTKKSVPLGSGFTYVAKRESDTMPTAAELVALCTEENKIGETSKGATLTYSGNVHKEQDDHGILHRIILIDEDAKLKLGIFSWCNETLTKLVSTGRIEKEGEYDVLKIGGLQNDTGEVWIVIFMQVDPKLGNLYIAIIGTNTAGLTLAFSRDNTTKLEPEFTALPQDGKGTLIKMFEAKPDQAEQTDQTEQPDQGA